MIQSKPLRYCLASLVVSFSSLGGANDEFFDLSLRELLQVQVVSKRVENVDEAPGVVSVITAADIQRFGARHLRDLIDRLPNTQVIGSALYPHNRTSMRGVTQTHLDDKVLILLNGRPLRDAGQGGVNGDIYSSFPLALLNQVEIIRGPGSVLYGTNAFAGVINLVTRSVPEEATAQLDLSLGSFATRELSISGAGQFNEVELLGSISSLDSNGDTFANTTAELGEPGDYKTGRQALESVLQASYKGFTLHSIVNKVLQKSGNNLLSFPSSDWNISRRFVDLGYQQSLNRDWDINANLTYNGLNNTAGIIGGTGRFFRTRSRGYLAEVSASGQLNDGLNLVVGSVYDRLKGDNVSDGTLNTDIDTWRASLYAQLDYRFSPEIKFSGGLQVNKPKDDDTDLAPRLAGVFTLADHWSLKLAYDQAYRSAFGLDLFLNASFLLGNPNLEPETINTYSAQLNYKVPSTELALTYYDSQHSDLISRTIDQSGQATLINDGAMDYSGLELEYQWQLHRDWRWSGNASYQTNQNDTGQKNTTYQPQWMLKSGLSYERDAYVAGLFASYFGEPTQLSQFNPDLAERNPRPESYVLLSANLSLDLSLWLDKANLEGLSVKLFADNLLNEAIHYPEISRQAVNSIPHHTGRSAYLTVTQSF